MLSILAIAAFAALAAPVEADHDPEVILEWDQILQSNLPANAGLFSFRYYAMMHIAMFDAVNSIEGDYHRYHVKVPANPAASPEAAAAQAAHDVLVALLPSAKATFDSALESRRAKIHPSRWAKGVPVGRKTAQAVLDWRTGDGSEQPNPPYLPPALPGVWEPTPATQVAAFAQFPGVEPFGLLTATQYLPDPPPLLNSEEYAENVADVQAMGSANSGVRSAEQTLLAKLFAGDGYTPNPFGLWRLVAHEVTLSKRLSLIETARMFALLNVAMNDGLQTSQTSKFIYGLWRPVSAIRRADEDMNPETAADPGWTPLLATPPYPSHSSNLACVAASAARALRRVLGTDKVPFSVTWTGANGNMDETRAYQRFSQLAEEGGLSRFYGGIHFMFEIEDSREVCKQVADYLYKNYMQPKR